MNIQIDGSGSVNKGAELMLAAVLQEIAQTCATSKVVINSRTANEDFIKSQYSSNYCIPRTSSFYNRVDKFHVVGLMNRISLSWGNYFTLKHTTDDIDIILDIGGFQFGDQWNHNKYEVDSWEEYLLQAQKYGIKFIFMPQAFGPFEKEESKRILEVLKNYSYLLIARDNVSYSHLIKGGIAKDKALLYPDFTSAVKPIETTYSINNNGKICIIPNSNIIKMGTMNRDSYLNAIIGIINHIYKNNKEVVLLNHEGEEDYNLCKSIRRAVNNSVEIVSGLNAVETKGVISSSLFVISSRFHGVANALSSCVPCLATSWSHKYLKLLEEYDQTSCLLDLSDSSKTLSIIDSMIDEKKNIQIRDVIKRKNSEVIAKNREMWSLIWKKCGIY